MNIDILAIGKTDSSQVETLVGEYLRRLNFYTKVTWTVLPDPKNRRTLSADTQKRQEGALILKQLSEGDWLVLLDEKGKEMRSMEFADWMQKRMNSGVKRLCFVIGGPYGFSKAVYQRANELLSLSRMTFSHQIVRVLFAEQLYRAFTILHNEPYHHE